MKDSTKQAATIGIIGNIILFLIKIYIGLLYHSIAVISDAINSMADIISSFVIRQSIKVSKKSADKEHPYGHHRAQPIAGLIMACFVGIFGFEVIYLSFQSLFSGSAIIIGY